MSSTVSRHAERLARAKEKERRKQNPAMVRGQSTIPAAEMHDLNQRIKSGRFGMLAPKEVVPVEEPPIPVEEIPRRMVNFILQKKCSCGAVNKYGAIECRKCRGHFCYDKSGAADSPSGRSD